MENIKSIQITVMGRVQNVGFRYHTKEKAIQLGINGFVKNQANGNVYIEAEGSTEAINLFIKWCHKGPDWAKVTDTKISEQPYQAFNGFVINPNYSNE